MPMNLLLAYFDPGAGSLLLQALVGGFGGVAVLGRYLWTQFIIGRHTLTVAVDATPSTLSLPSPHA